MKLKLLFSLSFLLNINLVNSQLVTSQLGSPLQANNSIYFESAEKWSNESFGNWDQSQEEIPLRDQNAKHFKNLDGSFTAIIAAGNIHYWENNRWNTIYHTIEPSLNGFRNITNNHKTYFPSLSSGSITTILPDGKSMKELLEMRMFFEKDGNQSSSSNIQGKSGNVNFNELIYKNVYGPGIDLRFTQHTTKRKMDYVVSNLTSLGTIPNGANYLVFEEKVELPNGWTFSLVENNILILDDSGVVKAVYEKPIFKDAPHLDSDGHSHSDEAEGTYVAFQNGTLLTIQTKVQLDWLTDVERIFPVVIDPTVNLYPNNTAWWTGRNTAYHTNSSSAQDAPLYSSSTFNNTTNDYIRVGRIDANYSYQSWSKFNISSLPNACINSVSLNYRVSYDYSGSSDCVVMGRLRHMNSDPVVTTGNTLIDDIRDGNIYEVRDFKCFTTGTGWVNAPMTANLNDLVNAIPSGSFSVGYNTFQGGAHTTCYTEIYGYSSTSRPYLLVDYKPYYQVQFSNPTPITFCAGQTQNVSVTVTNTGCLPWTSGSTSPNSVNFSWWGSWQSGGLAGGQDNNPRLTPFIALAPGASQTITFSVTPPSTPGTYSIQTDLVRDGVCWFRNNGAPDCGPGNVDYPFSITVKSVSVVNAGSDLTLCGGSEVLNGSATTTEQGAVQNMTFSGSGGVSLDGNYANGTPININVSGIPGGATITSINTSISFTANSPSYRSELRVEVTPPAAVGGVLSDIQPSTLGSSGSVTNQNFGTYGTGNPTGNWQFRFRESYDDSGVDANISNITITVNYTLPAAIAYSWSPTTGLSNSNIANPIVNIATTTIYTLTATVAGCSATDQVTVTIESPVGNPAVFGNNIWNVYGYNGDNTNLASNTYRGYYIQPDLGAGNHGVNTQAFWGNGNSPSDAGTTINNGDLWNGCNVNPDFHTVVQKRKGFPCGTYNLNMQNWDDETRVYLNGALIWSCVAWSGAGTCPTGNIGMQMLDGDSELEIRSFEQVGGSNVNMEIIAVAPTQLSLNGATRTCRVSGGNVFIFFLDQNGRLIAGINPQNQDLGYVTMTSYVDATNALVPACSNPNPIYMTSLMQRHWVIDKTNAAATPVQVGLPFLNAELSNLSSASTTNVNSTDDVLIINDVVLSKYHGPNNVNNLATDNCYANGGNENTSIHGQTGNGNLATVFAGFVNTSYTTYSVPDFSEFWLHGSINLSPLPVTLTSFAADCKPSENVFVKWITASENNSSHFVVERSIDGTLWEPIGQVAAAGNSTSTLSYQLEDMESRAYSTLYYRLQQYDNDGASEVYGPVVAHCSDGSKGFDVYPNPAGSTVTVVLHGNMEKDRTHLAFYDLDGKEVKRIKYMDQTSQLMYVDIDNLAPGCYIVRLFNGDENYQNVRLIKQ